MTVECRACHALMEVPYRLVGAPITCPTCGQTDIPVIRVGTRYPNTGYELTFADFQTLLHDSQGRTALKRRLDEWFGYVIIGEADSARIQSSSGRAIDPLRVHELVQADPEKRASLYQEAMALWR